MIYLGWTEMLQLGAQEAWSIYSAQQTLSLGSGNDSSYTATMNFLLYIISQSLSSHPLVWGSWCGSLTVQLLLNSQYRLPFVDSQSRIKFEFPKSEAFNKYLMLAENKLPFTSSESIN